LPTTITTYNSFAAGTKARASEVNVNFSNHRGNLLPIEEATATASHNTHDLGSLSHQWENLYLHQSPYVDGSQLTVTPVGAILPYAGYSAPTGFFVCDGSEISRITYAALFSVIGEGYGAGNLSTTFNIPDMRGRTFRCDQGTSGRDPDYLTRVSSLSSLSATGAITLGTTTISSLSSTFINRLKVGFRCWGTENQTTTTAKVYGNSITVSSIPAAVIATVLPGFLTWSHAYSTATVVSVNTAGAAMTLDRRPLAFVGTFTTTATIVLRTIDIPTSTIVSINTAGSYITLSSTITSSTISASFSVDNGAYIGSYQEGAVQRHNIGSSFDNTGIKPYSTKLTLRGQQNTYTAGSNYGAIQAILDTSTAYFDGYIGGENSLVLIKDSISGTFYDGSETRMKNLAVNCIIKY